MADAVRTVKPNGTYHTSWALTQADGTGAGSRLTGAADKTVHFFGTFGVTPTFVLEGSNDPLAETDPGSAVWTTLHDTFGAEITTAAALIAPVAENPMVVRPRLTAGGDGDTAVTVAILSRK